MKQKNNKEIWLNSDEVKLTPLTIRIPEDIREKIEDIKWENRTSMNSIIIQALKEYTEKADKS